MTTTNDTHDPNKTTAKDLDRTAIAGVQKYLASVTKITLGSIDYTPATLQAAFQAEIDAITASDALRSQWMQQVVDTAKVREKTRALRAILKGYLLATYGAEALQMLGDFGMKVPKNRGPRTAKAKAESQDKARKTRNAKKAALEALTSPPVVPAAASPSTTPAHS